MITLVVAATMYVHCTWVVCAMLWDEPKCINYEKTMTEAEQKELMKDLMTWAKDTGHQSKYDCQPVGIK